MLISPRPLAGLMLALAAVVIGTSAVALWAAPATQPGQRLHVLNDVTHVYNFFLAWNSKIGRAYLPAKGQTCTANHRTISSIDFEPFNVFWVPLGNNRDLPYADGDAGHVMQFVRDDGGGVFFYEAHNRADAELVHANAFVKQFGFQLTTKKMAEPIQLADHPLTAGIEDARFFSSRHGLKLTRPDAWEVLCTDADGRPMIAVRTIGKGRLVAAGGNLLSEPRKDKDGNRPPAVNLELVQGLLKWAGAPKAVAPADTMPFKLAPERTMTLETIRLMHSAYTQPYASQIGEIYEKLRPHMKAWMGVPLAAGKGRLNVHLLATGGGGWSSGDTIGLGVFWGGFPANTEGMIGLIGHELNHSWVLPHAEPLGNEGIAIYAGLKMAERLGDAEAVRADIAKRIEALRADPHFKEFDPCEPLTDEVRQKVGRRLTIRKYMVVLYDFEQTYGKDAVARYFRAKRKLVPARDYRYTGHDSAWIWSQALGEDVFGALNDYGIHVRRDQVTLPAAKDAK